MQVCESKSAGKTKYTVSLYFCISLDVRKQSLFPAPQPGEVGETGSRCRERQKEGRSKGSRKIIIIEKTPNKQKPTNQPPTASLCSVKHYILETICHSTPIPSLSLYGYTTVSGINIIFWQHSSAAALTVL